MIDDPGAIKQIESRLQRGWELIEETVLEAARSRTLTAAAAATPIQVDDQSTHPRLRGATALVVAPMFAAPEIA